MIHIVNSVYDTDNAPGYTRQLYYTYFHPLGLKELAESKGLRTAYCIVNLLESLERGEIENRLQALTGLKDDILATADGPMSKNTARVLLQVMKELVRAKGNYGKQLKLAHDFRVAAFGKPRVIRRFLESYHLIEMPEEWNQIAFDDHVHDANTSGRKSPTHLIMDAWIKGIRRLRVIYYHTIEPRFATELIQAARIMDIDLRIGIEFRAKYRGRYISFIWVSRGLPDAESFLCFLAEPRVVQFMANGKEVLRFKEKYALNLLKDFNENHLTSMCSYLGIHLEPFKPEAFLEFISPGQPSSVYLGEYIHWAALRAMRATVADWRKAQPADAEEQESRAEFIRRMETFTVAKLLSDYLETSPYFDMFQHAIICSDTDIPERLKMTFRKIIEEISHLHPDYRITLNVGNLKPEDVLELLYEGDGAITRLESINLKNFIDREMDHIIAINQLQQAINAGSLLKLKRVVRQILLRVKVADYSDRDDRLKKLTDILYDIDTLKHLYSARPLKTRIGSDSTGKPGQGYGMGFALINTLPGLAARKITKNTSKRRILPVQMEVLRRITISAENRLPILATLPGIHHLFARQKTDWIFESFAFNMKHAGNIVSLDRMSRQEKNDLGARGSGDDRKGGVKSWRTLNTKVKNTLKIALGFIPAFLCFVLTKEWWLLAYFGAFIWFGITGVRNILQSVIGGGGFRRTSLMKWNDFVSWDRLADSLFYTGFSVPLLDFVIKTLLLEKGLHITMSTSPLAVYSVMALANGIYLSSHNIFRGLPKAAATGNFFRSVFSIPVAVLVNTFIAAILTFLNVPSVDTVLQKWAAIISKGASDLVAGLIEGTAERMHNVRLRERDIKAKFSHLFETYSRLEQLFPETEELRVLENANSLITSFNSEVRDLAVMIIINSLDLLYFWMYLPRAKNVMMDMFERLTPEEKVIFQQSQNLLKQEKFISRLLVDGILGDNFPKPLSFYLTNYKIYLSHISSLHS